MRNVQQSPANIERLLCDVQLDFATGIGLVICHVLASGSEIHWRASASQSESFTGIMNAQPCLSGYASFVDRGTDAGDVPWS